MRAPVAARFSAAGMADGSKEAASGGINRKETQEESLLALVEHRSKEVEHLRKLIAHYQTQLVQAEDRLRDAKSKLGSLLYEDNAAPTDTSSAKEQVNEDSIKEKASAVPLNNEFSVTGCKPSPRPVNSSTEESQKQKANPTPTNNNSVNTGSHPRPASSRPVSKVYELIKHTIAAPVDSGISCGLKNIKEEVTDDVPKFGENALRGTKRKFDQKEHSPSASMPAAFGAPFPMNGTSAESHPIVNSAKKNLVEKSNGKQKIDETLSKGKKANSELKELDELIELVHSCSTPQLLHFGESTYVFSQHKRKLRSLSICPMDDRLFATRSTVSLISITDCLTPKQRSWPMDVAWHPKSKSLFSVYNVAADDYQVSVLSSPSTNEEGQVTFLNEKPHIKGTINTINFMPWEDACFATGGNDHAVVLWNDVNGGGKWTSKPIHRKLHSSSVMGVAGMKQKQIVMSAGADKRVIAFNVIAEQAEFTHQLDSKCLDILPNPRDFNLYMVQTGAHGKQIRLYDIRSKRTGIQPFGWTQASSESQSSLVNQSWSPDGLYITSGSADPVIHTFDIRYSSDTPSQSITAHQKRVFKAEWHPTLPLLLSISSDLNIGLHKRL
uniref:Uncharacterized protein n=1 Tax=Kalanchoe fedtschenkoi TaxID=63787 RepID=A0A7N0T009_KALFE